MKILYILVVFALISCDKNKKNIKSSEYLSTDYIEEAKNTSFKEHISALIIKATPVTVASNFNDFIKAEDHKRLDINTLKLNFFHPQFNAKDNGYKAISSYGLEISKSFYTIVVTVLKGEHEMETVLINYDLDGNIIDYIVVSYDEIAESTLKIESKIENNIITRKTMVNHEEINEAIEIFKIDSTGSIDRDDELNVAIDRDVLINGAITQLGLDKSKVMKELTVFKVQPQNSNETIIVIPELVTEHFDAYDFELNNHIVLVNNTTGKITHTYFESSQTNGWDSDAIMLAEITIDTAPYTLKEATRAFGVNVFYYNESQVNPYSLKTISLFVKSEATLIKILRNYEISKASGEWDMDCYKDYTTTKKLLIVSKEKTNGYNDIKVTSKTTNTKNEVAENGTCNSIEVVTKDATVLKFNGTEYKKATKK